MKRIILIISALLILLPSVCAASSANVPYQSYTYDYRKNVILTPHPYLPQSNVSGETLGISAFRKANDLAVANDGRLFVADTGNNRVVVVSADFKRAEYIIDTIMNGGVSQKLNAPSGVTVSESGEIYIADSGNRRVVVLMRDMRTVARVIENPEGEALPANYVFVPLRVAVDYADRVYVIAQNMFQGILVFDPTGEFSGFFGTINVTVTMWQRFWRAIASRAERANSVLFVPTEFTGLDIDPTGFVYASNIDPDGVKAVRRLNPRGEDVAKTGIFANLGGDLNINGNGIYGGASRIVDVTYVGRGIYALLDSQRGRIFAYDREGNLLYIFGGLGTQQGSFRAPSAIESANGTILVLDSVRNEIVVFSPTEYGALINEAVGLRFDGDEALAVEMWRRVLLLNENLEIANAGIGKAYLTAGDNAAALSYLELGMNRTYYSIAWKRFRNDVLKDSLAWILSGIVAIAAIWFIVRKLTKRGKKREDILADG